MNNTYARFFLVLGMAVALATAAVENEETAPYPKMVTCWSCKAYEKANGFTIQVLQQQEESVVSVLSTFCGQLPEDTQKSCTHQVKAMSDRFTDTVTTLKTESMCTSVFGCDPDPDVTEMLFMENVMFEGRYCDTCLMAASAVESSLDLQTTISTGAEAMRAFCATYATEDTTKCEDFITEAVEQFEVPPPEQICQILELCK